MSRDTVSTEVFTAVYSGVPVLEMTCRGVSVMRRRSDSALNATQILKVAGIQKGNRTKILEREILTGPHEKVQGGYGKYQGTWVSYEIGLSLCDRYSVRQILSPLLELDTASGPAMHATPTKEQHQASVRRHQHQNNNSLSRPAAGMLDYHKRPQSRSDSLAALSNGKPDNIAGQMTDNRERPNLGAGFTGQGMQPDLNGASSNDREWNGSHAFVNGLSKTTMSLPTASPHLSIDHAALAPLNHDTARDFDRSREIMTNIFLESDHGRLPEVLMKSSGDLDFDIDIPIDELGHTALHWASALARLTLVQALVARGAKATRGNGTGETALMRAVMATNTMDQNCFLDLLDILGSSLVQRDAAKRTVLHHIAITAGIKGRSAASRYYLTSLLEWIVNNEHQAGFALETLRPILIDAQDRNGDTAINIAARIGNRGIVQALLEVDANPYLPNNAGIRPIDSGTVDERVYQDSQEVRVPVQVRSTDWNNPAVKQNSGDVTSDITNLIESLQKDFELEMVQKCKAVDDMNSQLREASKALADLRRQVESSKQQIAQLDNINQRIKNTKTAIIKETQMYNENQAGRAPPIFGETHDADAPYNATSSNAPSAATLAVWIQAYKMDLKLLDENAVELNDQSLAMEERCRRLVAACTSSSIDEVDETLPALLAALQSDGDPREFDLNEANRVAGFLKILT